MVMTSLLFLVALFFTHLQKKRNNEISVSKDVISLRNLTNYVFLAKISSGQRRFQFSNLFFFTFLSWPPLFGLFHFVVYSSTIDS